MDGESFYFFIKLGEMMVVDIEKFKSKCSLVSVVVFPSTSHLPYFIHRVDFFFSNVFLCLLANT